MSNDSNKMLDTLADQSADLDDIIEDQEVSHREVFIELQLESDGRNVAIWQGAYNSLLSDFDALSFEDWFLMTTEDYAALEDSPLKQVYWQAMVAASKAQADVAVIRVALKVADKHANTNRNLFDSVSDSDKKKAAEEGIGNDRFQTAKDRKKNGPGSDQN